MASFVTGFGLRNQKPNISVDLSMLRLSQHFKVFWSIVKLVVIDVVNDLCKVRKDCSADFLLCYPTMFKDSMTEFRGHRSRCSRGFPFFGFIIAWLRAILTASFRVFDVSLSKAKRSFALQTCQRHELNSLRHLPSSSQSRAFVRAVSGMANFDKTWIGEERRRTYFAGSFSLGHSRNLTNAHNWNK